MSYDIQSLRGVDPPWQQEVTAVARVPQPKRPEEQGIEEPRNGAVGEVANRAAQGTEGDQPGLRQKEGQDDQSLRELVEQANEQAQRVRRQLEFEIDEVTGQTLIRIKNAETGEVIRQIPPEAMVEVARNLKENDSNMLFRGKA